MGKRVKVSKLQTTYSAEGYVLGKLWGGGYGAYPAYNVSGVNTLKELRSKIDGAIENGTLDSGMGFESLKGAVMHITKAEKVEADGVEYSHYEQHQRNYFFGNLTRKEKKFLREISEHGF